MGAAKRNTGKKGDDLMTFGGRVRAAMVQRGMDPGENAVPQLIKRWKQQYKGKGVKTPSRQNFHDWLKADRARIQPENLFYLADVLDVSPRWLSMNEGYVSKPISPDPELQRLLDAWNALKTPRARDRLIKEAGELLAIQGDVSVAQPLVNSNKP